jgi:hypothetical protein
MSIFEGVFLFRFTPDSASPARTLVVAVPIEGRVDVNQIDACVRKFSKLIEIIAAINDTRINECGRFSRRSAHKEMVRDVSTLLNMTKPQYMTRVSISAEGFVAALAIQLSIGMSCPPSTFP